MAPHVRRAKPQVIYSAGDSEDVLAEANAPKSEHDRRASLILTDFPSSVERPSLPVTPAPRPRMVAPWGIEGGEGKGKGVVEAEGVPDQAEWVCPNCGFVTVNVEDFRTSREGKRVATGGAGGGGGGAAAGVKNSGAGAPDAGAGAARSRSKGFKLRLPPARARRAGLLQVSGLDGQVELESTLARKPETKTKSESEEGKADAVADTNTDSGAKSNADAKTDGPEKLEPKVSQLEPTPKPEHRYRSGTSTMGAPLATLTDPALLSKSPPRLPWLSPAFSSKSNSNSKASAPGLSYSVLSKSLETSALNVGEKEEEPSASTAPWEPAPALAAALPADPVPTFAPSTPSMTATAPASAPEPAA